MDRPIATPVLEDTKPLLAEVPSLTTSRADLEKKAEYAKVVLQAGLGLAP